MIVKRILFRLLDILKAKIKDRILIRTTMSHSNLIDSSSRRKGILVQGHLGDKAEAKDVGYKENFQNLEDDILSKYALDNFSKFLIIIFISIYF